MLSALLFSTIVLNAAEEKKFSIQTAELNSVNEVKIKCKEVNEKFAKIKFEITPAITISEVKRSGPFLFITTKENFQDGIKYEISYKDPNTKGEGTIGINTTFLVEAKFNAMFTDKKLGYSIENGNSVFRVFIPRGTKVNLVVFDKYDAATGTTYEMKNDGNQVFEYTITGALWGKYYGYQIVERSYTPKRFLPELPFDTIFADPYSKVVASNNVFPIAGRTLIYDDSKFDWQGDKPLGIDIENAIIMEAHVRDLTSHPTAQSKFPGTFKGLVDAQTGGIAYLQKLGVNAVELLPVHDFNHIEAPYKISANGFRNTWNVYGRNYWGYMTSSFFSPETFYGSDGTVDPKKWNGTDGRVVDELKTAVKEFHKKGIAVVLDVVYNHVSQYDQNPLKLIDWDFYFKKADKTGCGNEVNTNRLMARKIILDSLKYYMTEYHIDGFRFDLASSHDKETVKVILEELKKINPKVYVIAEPWGGDGSSTKNDFKKIGWSYWNDSVRNLIRGGNNRPTGKGKSFMLGSGNNADQLAQYWQGTSQGKSYQSVSYIESHDDATLGDMIRILSGAYKIKNADGSFNRIKDEKAYLKLSPELLDASKVAATSLFLCQGPLMLHLGQEWARGKITPDLSKLGIEELSTKGEPGSSSDNVISNTPTPNSYSADNNTNYINYDYIALNKNLWDYYKGLIDLRKSNTLLGTAKPEQVKILNNSNDNKNSLGVEIDKKIYGFVNSDITAEAKYTIPAGKYSVVVNKDAAGTKEIKEINGGEITVEKASSIILIKK